MNESRFMRVVAAAVLVVAGLMAIQSIAKANLASGAGTFSTQSRSPVSARFDAEPLPSVLRASQPRFDTEGVPGEERAAARFDTEMLPLPSGAVGPRFDSEQFPVLSPVPTPRFDGE